MIPLGYCTIPEALELIEFKASEGSPFEWLDAALADAARLVWEHRPNDAPFVITEFIAHDSNPRL